MFQGQRPHQGQVWPNAVTQPGSVKRILLMWLSNLARAETSGAGVIMDEESESSPGGY